MLQSVVVQSVVVQSVVVQSAIAYFPMSNGQEESTNHFVSNSKAITKPEATWILSEIAVSYTVIFTKKAVIEPEICQKFAPEFT